MAVVITSVRTRRGPIIARAIMATHWTRSKHEMIFFLTLFGASNNRQFPALGTKRSAPISTSAATTMEDATKCVLIDQAISAVNVIPVSYWKAMGEIVWV